MRKVMKILILLVLIIIIGFQENTVTTVAASAKKAKEVKKPKVVKNPYLGEAVATTALLYIGVPYVWGGTSPDGFDCSGLICYVFEKYDINLPRTADLQFGVGRRVPYNKLQPGDVVFFSTYVPGPSHCGIYAGNEKFIHASSSKGVTISTLTDIYWKRRYLGARRMIN